MIKTIPTMHLTPFQVEQLLGYCATYRSYLWQCLAPAPERNQLIRTIQMVQGRLEKAQEQGQEVTFAGAEYTTVRQVLSGLTQAYGHAPPSERRTWQLGVLAAFRRQIEQPLRKTQAL